MTRAPLLISRFVSILAVSVPLHVHAGQPAHSWFGEQGYVAPAGTRIVACHGYGCVHRTAVTVDGAVIGQAGSLLRTGRSSPEAERRAVREIVRIYNIYLARQIGGEPDVPGSPPQMSRMLGQMDCVDETANTTSLLIVLEDRGLLLHHKVMRPRSRGLFIDGRYPHTTAVIAERRSGREWAVDPWKKALGQRPDILPLELWQQAS